METDLNINSDSSDSLDLTSIDSACRKRKITDYSEKAFKEINTIKIKENGGLLLDRQNFNLSCDSVISANDKIEKEQNDENSGNSDVQVSTTDMAKINAPHALIWFYFTKMEKDQYKAVCNICKIVRNIPTGTTTTLQNHLKRHVGAYNEYSKLKELKDISKTKIKTKSNKQMSLKNSFKSTVFLDPSNKRAQEITNTIAKFICKGLHAYSIVEEPAFKDLIFLLEPRYVVPCRTTFSRSVVPKLYKNLKERMLNIIKSAKTTLYSVCMTTDLWTSRSGDSYIAFTLQFLNEDFVMQHMTVDCQPFPGKHDSTAICDKVENIFCELDLLDEKIKKYIVSDNGANMVKALSKNSLCNLENDLVDMAEAVNRKFWEHILCYNHTLQLTISDTRKEMNANNIIEKVSNIVARYNRSKSARESLEHFQAKQKIPKHDLIQMVCTRWDSEFLMLERFLEQKSAIISEMNKADIDGLTVQEWKLLEGYVEVLRPIANFTAEMGSRSKPTFSMVLPVLFEIKSSLEDIIKKAPKGTGILFARKLLANIKLRFIDSNYWESPLYRIAMLLDPRFKNTLSNKDSASLLEEKAIEALRENTKSTTFETKVQINQSLPESFTKTSKWRHLKKKVNIRNINSPNEETKIKIEVENYLKSPTISEQEDPLTWWKVNALTFPFLVPLARRYLAIAATETSSERVFSVGGNVVTNKRTNLLAENVRQTIFCHDNLAALDGIRF